MSLFLWRNDSLVTPLEGKAERSPTASAFVSFRTWSQPHARASNQICVHISEKKKMLAKIHMDQYSCTHNKRGRSLPMTALSQSQLKMKSLYEVKKLNWAAGSLKTIHPFNQTWLILFTYYVGHFYSFYELFLMKQLISIFLPGLFHVLTSCFHICSSGSRPHPQPAAFRSNSDCFCFLFWKSSIFFSHEWLPLLYFFKALLKSFFFLLQKKYFSEWRGNSRLPKVLKDVKTT